jgi:hypothetical protein
MEVPVSLWDCTTQGAYFHPEASGMITQDLAAHFEGDSGMVVVVTDLRNLIPRFP